MPYFLPQFLIAVLGLAKAGAEGNVLKNLAIITEDKLSNPNFWEPRLYFGIINSHDSALVGREFQRN